MPKNLSTLESKFYLFDLGWAVLVEEAEACIGGAKVGAPPLLDEDGLAFYVDFWVELLAGLEAGEGFGFLPMTAHIRSFLYFLTPGWPYLCTKSV